MAFKSDVETLVLSALHHGPKHGYLIAKHIKTVSNQVLKIGESAIYPVLQELEKRGSVSSSWEMQDGRPPKKLYQITQAGLKEFETQKSSWEKFSTGINSIIFAPVQLEGRNA